MYYRLSLLYFLQFIINKIDLKYKGDNMNKTSSIKKILAKNVKYLREKNNLTIKELSHISGISTSFLTKIENMQTKGLLLSHLEALSTAFKISVKELLNHQG